MPRKIDKGVKLGTIEANPGITSAVVKPPTFDDQIPWAAYKQQFEAAASTTAGQTQKMPQLISLRGQALSVLQSLQVDQRDSYGKLVETIELRFGEQHQKKLHQVQLKARTRKPNESLKEFEGEI